MSQKRDSPEIILYMFWVDIRFLNEKNLSFKHGE